MPALTEERASLLSEKTVLLEFEAPSEQNTPPLGAGIALATLVGEETTEEAAAAATLEAAPEPPTEGAMADAGDVASGTSEGESEQVILVDLMDMEDPEPTAPVEIVAVESDATLEPQEPTTNEVPMEVLVVAAPVAETISEPVAQPVVTAVAEEPADTNEAPVAASEPEETSPVQEPIEGDSEAQTEENVEEEEEAAAAAPRCASIQSTSLGLFRDVNSVRPQPRRNSRSLPPSSAGTPTLRQAFFVFQCEVIANCRSTAPSATTPERW